MKHKEAILAVLAVVLTAVLLITKDVSMSTTVQTMLVAVFTIAVLAYGAFVLNERPADEREYENSLIASKYAYLAGAGILTIAIITQSVQHDLDPWLPITLAGMVLAKSLSHLFKK